MNVVRRLGLALLLSAGVITQAYAKVEPLDRIAAIVNNDVVMESQLQNRMHTVEKQLEARGTPMPPKDLLEKQVLDRLVLESIQLQMGERAGVRIDEATLNNTVADIARRNGLSLEQFRKAVAADGMSYQQVRDQIRDEMIIARVRQHQVAQRIHITDQDIDNYLSSEEGKAQATVEYHLGHILVPVPEAATPQQLQASQKNAEKLVANLHKNNSDKAFAQMAVSHSAGQNALEGGDLGWRTRDQLPTLFAPRVPGMDLGQVVGPIRSPSGFHIIKLLGKRGEPKVIENQVKVRHILIKPSAIMSNTQAKALAEKLYKQITDKQASFADLAKKYSEDPGSKLAGGELGWVDPRQMVPAFQAEIEKAPLNRVMKPFESRFGWHIIEVQGRRSQDMSKQAMRNHIRELIFNRRYEEELQNWLQEIRSEAYVDIKQ